MSVTQPGVGSSTTKSIVEDVPPDGSIGSSSGTGPTISSTGVASNAAPANEPAVRSTMLQRIQQRKEQIYSWSHSKKLLKLAIYSACQVESLFTTPSF